MSIVSIKDAAENILNRIETVKGRGEEATKQAMVLPMLDALGYDIWNPDEVCPEYEADVAVKKGGQKEKVDYAILLGGEPRIFIEVKSAGEPLDGHQGQLKRYFMSTSSVSLGILTNGVEYRFFTDTGEPNIQDDDPFHIVRLEDVDQGLEVMARFQRDVFSPASIREYATELTYTAKIVRFLKSELDVQDKELGDEFVGWILRSPGMYEGRVMQSVIERFRPIAKTALQRVLSSIIRRIVTEIDAKVGAGGKTEGEPESVGEKIETSESLTEQNLETDDQGPAKSPGREIVTTEEELECFAIVKRIFDNSIYSEKTIYNPARKQDLPLEIGYKDTTGYFGIYFNKPSWWNMRIFLDGKTKWVGFDIDPEEGDKLLPDGFTRLPPCAFADFRVQVNSPQDLLTLSEIVHACFEKTIQDREKLREKQ